MAGSKPRTSRPPKRGGRWVHRNSGSGEFVGRGPSATGAGPGLREDDFVERLVDISETALDRSRRSGRVMRFTVVVDPQGGRRISSPEPHEEEPHEEAGRVQSVPLEAALTAARARGRTRVAEILRGDDMLSADEFAALVGTTRTTVNAKRQKRQVLGLEGATRGFRFPSWQLGEDGRPFEVLPDLFDRLGDSPWAVYRFLVQHHPELDGMTAREALRRGRSQDVLAVAETAGGSFS